MAHKHIGKGVKKAQKRRNELRRASFESRSGFDYKDFNEDYNNDYESTDSSSYAESNDVIDFNSLEKKAPAKVKADIKRAKKSHSLGGALANKNNHSIVTEIAKDSTSSSKIDKSNINPGDVYWVHRRASYGSEIANPHKRPAVIISSAERNKRLDVVMVVFLTTSENRPDIPCYPKISYKSGSKDNSQSTIICDQVTTLSTEFLASKIGTVTDDCLQDIRYGINWSLGGSDSLLSEIKAEKAFKVDAFTERKEHGFNGLKDIYSKLAAAE